MAIATIDELDACVKKEHKNKWSLVKSKLFVLDESDAWDLRKPGKWKKEFSTSNGALIM